MTDQKLDSIDPIRNVQSSSMATIDNKSLYLVSDSQGFIAAFRSIESAKTVLAKYMKLNLLWYKFTCSREIKDDDIVYTLPYRNGGHIAFADIDSNVVAAVQTKFCKIDLVYPDDVKLYWNFPIGKITLDGLKRLEIWRMLAVGLTEEQKKMLAENEQLLANSAKLIEKDFETKPDSIDINLTDCIISENNVDQL